MFPSPLVSYQVVVGTKVGRVKHMRIMPGGALEQEQQEGPSSVYVGRKLDEHRGAFHLEYPMEKGHVTDGGWDAMERVWEVRICTSVCLFVFYF
jgi:centractin